MKKLLVASLAALAACSSSTPNVAATPPPAPPTVAQPAPSPVAAVPDVDARRKQLNALLDEQWQYTLRTAPELATIFGDHPLQRPLERPLARRRSPPTSRRPRSFTTASQAIDTTGFPEQEALNQQLMVRAAPASASTTRSSRSG